MKSFLKFVIFASLLFAFSACGPVTPIQTLTPTTTMIGESENPVPSTKAPETIFSTVESSDAIEKSVANYRLAPWSQNKALLQIREIKNLAMAGQLEFYGSLPENLAKLQSEIVLRNPDFSGQNTILWDIVRNEPRSILLPDSDYQTDLLAFLIADTLNQNIVPLAELADYLSMKGIWMDWQNLLVRNGLGTGIDVTYAVFRIMGDGLTPNWSIYAIWREGAFYRVEKVIEWESDLGNNLYTLFDGGDVNRNGIREFVLLIESSQSGDPGYSDEVLGFYEWSPADKKFIFLQRVLIFAQMWDEGPGEGQWSLQGNDQLITKSFWDTGRYCPQVTIEHIYRWEGKRYVEQGVKVAPPAPADLVCRFGWANAILKNSELGWHSDEAIKALNEVLTRWPQEFDKEWGPAIRDYYRLQLGLWRDFRGEEAQALDVMGQLSASPTIKEFDLPARLAAIYLAEREKTGFAKACLAIDRTYSSELESIFPNGRFEGSDSLMLQKWGFLVDDFPGWSGLLCSDIDAFPANIKHSRLVDVSLVPDWLTANGFIWYQKFEFDFNNDSTNDLLISLDTYRDNNPDVWLFFQEKEGVKALLAGRFSSYSTIEAITQSSADFQMTLVSVPDSMYPGDSSYSWNMEKQTFQHIYEFSDLQSQVEQQIFSQQNYSSAIQSLEEFLRNDASDIEKMEECGYECSEGYIPYFRYLLAVSYELSGQAEQAKLIYYQLWHDYPKNIFGMAAMQKLEPVP